MRMSAKAEYAVRAMVELATVETGVLMKLTTWRMRRESRHSFWSTF